jgi:4-hydroxybenzoate polyprenyltransferase
MKRFVGSEWQRVVALAMTIAILTLVAVGVTHTGAGGIYLFAIVFMTIALLIERHQESGP